MSGSLRQPLVIWNASSIFSDRKVKRAVSNVPLRAEWSACAWPHQFASTTARTSARTTLPRSFLGMASTRQSLVGTASARTRSLHHCLSRSALKLGVRLHHHRGRHCLTGHGVRNTEGARLDDFRMPLQQHVDLLGLDLDAAAIDLRLEPPDQRQPAVGIDLADIARTEPAVEIRRLVEVGPLPVAEHESRRLDQHLAAPRTLHLPVFPERRQRSAPGARRHSRPAPPASRSEPPPIQFAVSVIPSMLRSDSVPDHSAMARHCSMENGAEPTWIRSRTRRGAALRAGRSSRSEGTELMKLMPRSSSTPPSAAQRLQVRVLPQVNRPPASDGVSTLPIRPCPKKTGSTQRLHAACTSRFRRRSGWSAPAAIAWNARCPCRPVVRGHQDGRRLIEAQRAASASGRPPASGTSRRARGRRLPYPSRSAALPA